MQFEEFPQRANFGLLVCLLFFSPMGGYSQYENGRVSFGEFSTEEIEMVDVDFDKGAEAVVLYDYGESQYSSGKTAYKWHYRIKVLTDDGVKWRSFEEDNDGVHTFKASTFNFVDNKVVETKLDEKLLKKLMNRDSSYIIFDMPDVVKGSIMEIYYESSYPTREWSFQNTIPVVWSEFVVRFPENIEYSRSVVGPHIPHIIETKIADCDWSERCRQERVVMKDLPRLKLQRHMPDPENYKSAVNFHIDTRRFRYGSFGTVYTSLSRYHFTGDWQGIAEYMRDLYFVSDQVRFLAKLKPVATSIKKNSNSSMELVDSLFNYVRTRIKWDGWHHIFSSRSSSTVNRTRPNYFSGALEEGEGNSADINMIFLSMLRYAGFSADPVLISTKTNGLVRIDNPTSRQLNHVVVLVTIDGHKLLIDCTGDNLPLTHLPRKSLNGVGLAIFQDRFEWLELTTGTSSRIDVSTEIIIDGADLTRRTTLTATGYYAERLREDANGRSSNKNVEHNRIRNIFEIDGNTSISNLDDHANPLVVKFYKPVSIGTVTDSLWFAPIDLVEIDTLYLSDEERLYAFDIEYPRMENYTTKVKIPGGYSVKSLPAPRMLLLPDRSGKFIFNAAASGENMTIICQLVLSKSIYDIDEYAHVKELLKVAIAKLREPVVLQKSLK